MTPLTALTDYTQVMGLLLAALPLAAPYLAFRWRGCRSCSWLLLQDVINQTPAHPGLLLVGVSLQAEHTLQLLAHRDPEVRRS